jgi:Cd2+/Zn2+-exporting ATPase
VKLRPERAKVKDPVSGKFVFVPASCVAVGSIVSVRTGDKIPCDGVVVEGSSVVDESSLTGESRPVRKVPSAEVSGGTINAGVAQLLIRTTSTADNSAVARLIRLVEDAQANRSPTEKCIDSFAKRYTPLVVLLAFSMCTFPWIVSNEVGREWTKIGLVTIVIACPCALIISTPVTYVAGLAAAAQRGIVVKGGAHLEVCSF